MTATDLKLTTEDQESTTPWADDVLGREQLGEMLEKHIIAHASTNHTNSLTIALDGRWGSGKTFFVGRWAEALKHKGHGVVMFDAWSHDYAPDPTLAFMAELRTQLRLLLKDGNCRALPAANLTRQLDAVTSSLKRAAIPAGRLIAGGLIKKLIGAGLDELTEAIARDNESDPEDTAQSVNSLQIDKALDVYLDQLLQEHDQRKQSILQFRRELFSLVESLIDAKAISGPLFVIIDELDRCRPDFAIKLLEGVKHIFNVVNVVFIVATNANQLSSSIQAVYGPNFNGRDYLGRFFDLEVQLPTPTPLEFSLFLVSQYEDSLPQEVSYGTLYPYVKRDAPLSAVIWSSVSSALSLTLRQEEQAHVTFQLACQSWSASAPIPGLWLAFLSALHRSNPALFLKLQESREAPNDFPTFQAELHSINWQDVPLLDWSGFADPRHDNKEISLALLLFHYYCASKLSVSEACRQFEAPANAAVKQVSAFIRGRRSSYPTPLHDAFQLISTAGAFTAQ